MNEDGQSHSPVVPAKPANKAASAAAESVEERGLAKGNTDNPARSGHSAGIRVARGLDRVRQVAIRNKEVRFTALLHHVTVDLLRDGFKALRREAAPGVDGTTWEAYGQNLEANLQDLHGRLHRGAYRAKPSRRVYIPKADGRQRPLGVAALEDKIVQRAVVEVLNAIYEPDFLGFSYGFRPGRIQLNAINVYLVRWAMQKFKRYRTSKLRAWRFLAAAARREPDLFAHWAVGVKPTGMGSGSRVSREVYARF